MVQYIACSPQSGATYPTGTTTVTCTVVDSLISPECSFTITVKDHVPPSITSPGDQVLCNADYGLPGYSDNCPGVTLICTPPPGDASLVGTETTVTCTATDASSNTATCWFDVTVVEVQIDDVFRGPSLPDSVSLGASASVPVGVIIAPDLTGTGHSVLFDVNPNGGNLGDASVVGVTTLTSSDLIYVQGNTQTSVGPGLQLKVRARLDGATDCGLSPAFAVCAHPQNVRGAFVGDVNSSLFCYGYIGGCIGMQVEMDWDSDGAVAGLMTDLDGTEVSEQVVEGPRDDPPFSHVALGVSSYGPGDFGKVDTHVYPRAAVGAGPVGAAAYNQLWIFRCHRCNAIDIAIPNSGFAITHYVLESPVGSGQWYHYVEKNGQNTALGYWSSDAGDCNGCRSPLHAILLP